MCGSGKVDETRIRDHDSPGGEQQRRRQQQQRQQRRQQPLASAIPQGAVLELFLLLFLFLLLLLLLLLECHIRCHSRRLNVVLALALSFLAAGGAAPPLELRVRRWMVWRALRAQIVPASRSAGKGGWAVPSAVGPRPWTVEQQQQQRALSRRSERV